MFSHRDKVLNSGMFEKKYIDRLNRIEGQARGIKKMVVEDSIRKREVEERLKRRISVSAVETQ